MRRNRQPVTPFEILTQGGMAPPWNATWGPVPEGYDPGAATRNPMGSVPAPFSGVETRGFWVAQPTVLDFVAVAPGMIPTPGEDVIRRARWQSALFDLRPNFQGAFGGQPVAQPIWKEAAFGQGIYLHVLVTGPQTITSTLRVSYLEVGSIDNPDDAVALTQPQEITSIYYDGYFATLLPFYPPGSPLRFWRVNLLFDQLDEGDAPRITVQAYCG